VHYALHHCVMGVSGVPALELCSVVTCVETTWISGSERNQVTCSVILAPTFLPPFFDCSG
jgi:hypothetical protein